VFPLRARPGGVLERPGHTESAVDLCRLAGLAPAGVLAEVTNEDGTTARRPELARFAAEGLPVDSREYWVGALILRDSVPTGSG
jgi:3,4-dihydroxy-2-butanone 4-phosphate synthase